MISKSTHILTITLLSFLHIPSFGQRQAYIDSLNKKLLVSLDSQKISTYNGLSWAYKFSNPTLAFEYAEKSLFLSKKFNNHQGEAISLNRMGSAKLRLGELEKSLDCMLKAVEICKTYNFNRILATSIRQIGEVYEAQGNTTEAMKNYYNSLGIADSLDRPVLIARSALKVGGLYITINNYKNAKGYLDYAIKEFEKDDFLRGLHQAYILEGDYYYKKHVPDSAFIYYKTALNYLDNLEDKQGYATVKVKIADVFEYRGNFKKAIAGYFEALDTFKVIADKKAIVHIYKSLAQVYLKANDASTSTYYGKLALEKAHQLGLSNEEKDANFVLYHIYKNEDNNKVAIGYLENYMFLLDSLIHSTESWLVNQMRNSYELEIQLKQNQLNNAIINNQNLTIENNKLLRNFLLILVFIVCGLTILIWYALKHARKVNRQLILANEEKNEAISLISHDLKSPFNKISGLLHILELQLESTDDSIKEILSKINFVTHDGLTLVQNLVDIKALKSGSYQIKLSSFDLNSFLVKRILGFEQVAKSKNIVLHFVPTDGTCKVVSDINSLARIFDNILSNAIKFSPNGETVTIDCSIVDYHFSISISDNGKGISKLDINEIFNKYKTGIASPTGNELSNGLGLAIVSSLINKLNGAIKCISEPNQGATFIVSLPANKEEDI